MRSLFIGLISLFSVAALNATAAIPTDAQGTVQETAPSSIGSRIRADLFGWTYGNSINNWDGRRATANGKLGDPIQINSQIILHTPAFGPMDFSIVGNFVVQPFMGTLLQGQDPAIGMQGVVFERGGFSYWARYHFITPVTGGSRAQGMIVAPESINSVSYRFPGTKLKLEGLLVPSIKFYNDSTTSSFVYASPRLYYLATDSFWLMTILEASWESKKGTNPNTLGRASDPNWGFGFRYTANNGKGMYVQPFINTFPFGGSIADSHLGVIFGGPLL